MVDHKAVANAKTLNISTEKNEVSYKMSPSIGVLKDDIKLPLFEGIKSQNVTKSTPEILENAPLEVVDYTVDGGVSLLYKRVLPEEFSQMSQVLVRHLSQPQPLRQKSR